MTALTDTEPEPHTVTPPKPGRNDLREVLTVALEHQRAGHLTEAERIYQRVLAVEPEQPDALHLLGVLALNRHHAPEAVTLLERAITAAPHAAAIHNALATAQRATRQLNNATASYRRAVELDPANVAFRTNLAAALLDSGAVDEALTQAQQAVAAAPSYADGQFVLGTIHRARGDHAAAELCFAQSATTPALAPLALLNLGNTRRDLGRFADAVEAYRTAVTIDPGHVAARFALGVTLEHLGRWEDALATLSALVENVPEHRDAWLHVALIAHQVGATAVALDAYLCAQRLGLKTEMLYTNLGLALAQLGRLDEAATAQECAIAVGTDEPRLHVNLAITLRQAGRLDAAAAVCERAIAIDPSHAPAHSVLGSIRVQQQRQSDALAAHTRALALQPDSPIVLNEFANALMADGDIDGALNLYRDALARAPDAAPLHFHLGLALLAAGQLREGWAEYAWRHALPNAQPVWAGAGVPWRGEPLEGRSILVWREQGLGDEVMFASCLPDLAASGARVVLVGTPRLHPLYRRSLHGLDVIDPTDRDAHRHLATDFHAAIGTLPRWLRSEIGEFPRRPAFLAPDPTRVAHWRDRLRQLGDGPSVGVCWRSGLLTPSRDISYAPLRDWAPVFRTPGIRFVSLQYDECSAEIAAIERVLGVTVHRWAELDLRNDLDETAAFTAALDLAITAPTAAGELAGALGVPTWRVADERDWTMLGTSGRPWFPTMEVFPRPPRDGWTDLLLRVAARLAAYTPTSARSC
jgi:tetratricopeptide (TPR) repeat protein